MHVIKYKSNLECNELTIHSLITKIFGRKNNEKAYKVLNLGRQVIIYTNAITDLEIEQKYEFNHNKQKLVLILTSCEKEEETGFKHGQFVTASGIISYGVNLTDEKKSVCPVISKDRLNNKVKDHFLHYLEANLGIDLTSESAKDRLFNFLDKDKKKESSFLKIHSDEFSSLIKGGEKIEFNQVFSFIVSGYVVNENKVNSLLYRSIGRRRSYGFGGVNVGERY